MRIRTLAGALLAAPALLVTMATNGHAATPQGAVAFAGRITIVPSATSPGSASFCFSAVTCLDEPGLAAGVANAKPVVSMQGTLDYAESCTAVAPYSAVGTGHLSATFSDPFGVSTPAVSAGWIRAGLIAVIVPAGEGTVAGAALVAPLPKAGTVPLCGAEIDLAVVGAVAFA